MRRFSRLSLVSALLLAASVSAHATSLRPATSAAEWPRFHFDQQHTGVQPNESTINTSNVGFLGLSWQAQLGALVDYSSPAISGGVAYIGSSDGRLWAYPAGGCGSSFCDKPLWKSTSLAQIIDSPTVANGFVYVGSQTSADDNDGKLDVFFAAGCGRPVCRPLWQGDAGPDSILQSSPAVSGGFVYVGAFDGNLYVFDANGCGPATVITRLCQPEWTASTGGTIESSPTVDGGVVYVGSDDGKLYAFPAAGCGQSACSPLWKGEIGEPVFDSTPAVSNGVVYVGSSHHLSAFPAAGCGLGSCSPLWQGSWAENFVDGSPAVYNGRVYIGLEEFVGVFSDCGLAQCGPDWVDFEPGTQASVLSSPAIANGVLYAGKNNHDVAAWSAEPCGTFVCDSLWSFRTGDPLVTSSPAIVDGTLYIGGSDGGAPEDSAGRLYAFRLT